MHRLGIETNSRYPNNHPPFTNIALDMLYILRAEPSMAFVRIAEYSS
jgi:hypothetical protein